MRTPIKFPLLKQPKEITLRDYFAGISLEKIMSYKVEYCKKDETIAGMAYSIADAMVEKRNKYEQ